MRRYFPALSALFLAPLLAVGSTPQDGRPEVFEIKGWGKMVDPDGDCKVSLGRESLSLAVPGKVHALSAESGRMNAPRFLQDVEGDFIAEVKVSGVCPPSGASEVPGRRPFRGAGLLVWQDPSTFVRLERAGMLVGREGFTFSSFETRRNGRFERAGNTAEMPLAGDATFLRLERRGDTLIGSVSPDGVSWSSLKPLTFDLPRRTQVGIAAVHNTTLPFEPRFEGLRLTQSEPAR